MPTTNRPQHPKLSRSFFSQTPKVTCSNYNVPLFHIHFTMYIIHLTHTTQSCSILSTKHEMQNEFNGLGPCPSSPRYSHTYALIPSYDAPESEASLIIHQPAESLWISCNSIPHRCVPFTRIHNLIKIGQSRLCTGNSIQKPNLYIIQQHDPSRVQYYTMNA